MSSATGNHVRLPEELLNEILFRSSAESLLRAKCACKWWRALIQNPCFISNHFQHQKDHNKGRLLLQYYKEDIQQHSYALFDDETLQSDTYRDIDHLQLQWYHLHMEGPLNGLYCLFNGRDRIVMWNPALMESKPLPLPIPNFLPHISLYEGYIGFGVGQSLHDYKFVLICIFHDEHDLSSVRYVTVYNLITNTWRLLKNCNFHLVEYGIYENENNSFLDGSCHWWGRSGVVIAFDMTKETFHLITGPDLPNLESSTGSLAINNDKVSLIVRYDNCVHIWVMLEEGVWTKQFSITSLPRFSWDIGIWKDNGCLLAMDGFETDDYNPNYRMVLCNSVTQEKRVMGPKGIPMSFRASVYYESLVSLRTGHEGKRASLNTISDFLERRNDPYWFLYMYEDENAGGSEGEGTG